MTTLIPIQSAAMWYVDQVRLASEVGARSGFQSGLDERSSVRSTKSLVEATPSWGCLSAGIAFSVVSAVILLAFGAANLRMHHHVAAAHAAEIFDRRVAAFLHEVVHAGDQVLDHRRAD